jgi:hypothetical protein
VLDFLVFLCYNKIVERMDYMDRLLSIVIVAMLAMAVVSAILTYNQIKADENAPILTGAGIVVEKAYHPETSYMTRQGKLGDDEEFFVRVSFGEEQMMFQVSNETYRNISVNDPCIISYQKVSWGARVINSSIPTFVR